MTPSATVWAILSELNKVTGKPKASIIAELLHEVAPALQELLEAQKAVADTPEKAREIVNDYGWRSVQTIAQAQLDLVDPPRKRKSRKAAHAGAT